jgi:hypothetical protein
MDKGGYIMAQVIEKFYLIIFQDGRQVALDDITNYTEEQLEKMLLIQERQGRTWEYQKTFTWKEGER